MLSDMFLLRDDDLSKGDTCGMAISSLILGIISLIGPGPITAIPGIILGHLSRERIKRLGGKLQGEGLAIAGLITGYVSIGVTVCLIIGFFLFYAEGKGVTIGAIESIDKKTAELTDKMHIDLRLPPVPSRVVNPGQKTVKPVLRPSPPKDYSKDIARNEQALIAFLQLIIRSQEDYKSANGQYAGSLRSLPLPGTQTGYQISLLGSTNTYRITAKPDIPEQTGRRYFYVDESGIIRANPVRKADKNDDALF